MVHPPPVPGFSDVWNHVTFPASGTPATTPETETTTPEADASPSPRRRRPLLIAALATVLVATGGTVAVAGAHKTVTLDVDGATTTVSTFSGSVAGVLEAHGLELGPRDVVVPAADEALSSGDEIVVRHARQVVVLADGEPAHVWTTALSADEALAALSARGDEVRLLASRSADGRASLSVRLGDGPVDVLVDGETLTAPAPARSLEQVLRSLDVTVGELDRVSVDRTSGEDGPRVAVTVQRVVADEVATVTEVPFETVTQGTDALFRGQSDVAQEGVVGEHTVVDRVILVDGEEESRMTLSEGVTREPVQHVVREGTKERPKPTPQPAPQPTQRASSGSSSSGSSPAPAAQAAPAPAPAPAAPSGDVWARLAQCESGGNPSIVSANGLYHGLYQFRVDTWASVGGSGLPSQASPAEQTQRAQILQARSGWGQWPACSRKLGLR